MSFQAAALALAWIAILLLSLAMSGLMRQLHALQAHREAQPSRVGLPPGSPTPSWIHEIVGNDKDRSTLLLFADPGCVSCELILPEVVQFSRSSAGSANVLVVTREEPPPDWGASDLVVLRRPDAFSEFGISFVPAGVAISADGSVISTQAMGSPERIRNFLAQFDAVSGA